MRWLLGSTLRERRMRAASALAVAVGLLFVLWAQTADPLYSFQRLASDAQFREQDGSPNIVLVGIDDAALDAHNRLQDWPRTLHADAIRALNQAGARVIVYDVLFADTGSVEEDEALAAAMSESAKVILPVVGNGVPAQADGGYRFDSFTEPASSLASSSVVVAHANLITDSDGRVREVPQAVTGAAGEAYVSMTMAAVYLQFGSDVPARLPIEGGEIDVFGRAVPLDEHGAMRINYLGGSDRFTTIRFDDLLSGDFDGADVQGKIAIVGILATAADVHAAPLLGNANGMEIHANALDTVLRARFLRSVPSAVTAAIMVAFVLAAGLAVSRWRPVVSLALVAAVSLGYLVSAVFMFNQGRVADFVDPIVALWVSTVAALTYRVASETAAQRQMHQLFGRYLSPQVARELVDRADRGQIRLGGELREVSVLFADIRGFTPLSARTPPADLVALLNQHLEVIITSVMENGGIVNKFAGDAIMALWNAPDDQPDHALMACRAALQSLDGLDALSDAPLARWGFGISTGVALAGNVGSGRRSEYTVIGDCVNLAARLCGIAPADEVWVSSETHRQVAGRLESDELSPQPVKGFDALVVPHRLKRELRRVATRDPAPA